MYYNMVLQRGQSGLALDFVNFDLITSIVRVRTILLGELHIWQNWHCFEGNMAEVSNESQQNIVADLTGHPQGVPEKGLF